ncbi:MAG TPA: VWA domain-containing protein [Polyangia bacterium]
MFVEFFYELRKRGVKVGPQEALAVSEALSRDLHETTLDGFYEVARALCVHREQDLDAFDTAFASYFHGIELEALKISEEMLEWLAENAPRRELTDEERKLLESLDLEEARRRLEARLREQRERHDRGNRWVGTGGTSPHGKGGTHPSGITVGEGGPPGGRSAMARAGAHRFRELRGDVNLDVRSIELALRRLRAFVREGALTELDVEATIDKTASNAGELEIVMRPERRPDVKVLLLIDVGGSMDPHVQVSERLFSAAKRATHWKRLDTFYFHNCLYGHVYPTTWLRDGIAIPQLLAERDATWKLIVVGDALMHPSELWQTGGWGGQDFDNDVPGLAWLDMVARHFRKTAWLNPEPERFWHGTADTIKNLFPMFRLSLDGLAQAVAHLTRGRRP